MINLPKQKASKILSERKKQLDNTAVDFDNWIISLDSDIQFIFGSGEELVSSKRIAFSSVGYNDKTIHYNELIDSFLLKINAISSEHSDTLTNVLDESEIKIDKKSTILFLAANPLDSSRLRLDEEFREIESRLRSADKRDNIKLVSKWAITVKTLQTALINESPSIVHFSGHGNEKGIVVENSEGDSKPVSIDAICSLFRPFSGIINCVILNACYSESQAKKLSNYIPYVIGMKDSIDDNAAINFAIGFYDAVAAGKTIPFAYEMGKALIQLENIEGHEIPVLIDKNKIL